MEDEGLILSMRVKRLLIPLIAAFEVASTQCCSNFNREGKEGEYGWNAEMEGRRGDEWWGYREGEDGRVGL